MLLLYCRGVVLVRDVLIEGYCVSAGPSDVHGVVVVQGIVVVVNSHYIGMVLYA